MAADMTSAGKKPGGGDKDPAARAELERKHGQIFIITESEYIGAILPLYGVTTGYDTWVKKPKNKAVVKTIFAEITSFMKNRTIQLMSGVGTFAGPLPVKGKTIGSKEQRKKEQQRIFAAAAMKAKKYKKIGTHVFVVPTFESAKGAKFKGAKKGSKETINISNIAARHLNKHFNKEATSRLISSKHQLGHGDKGPSVAEYKVVRSQQLAAKEFNLTKQEVSDLNAIYVESKDKHIDKINIKHAQDITSNGRLKKDYTVILTMQDKDSNEADRKKEAAFVASVRKRSAALAAAPGSTKLSDAIEQTLMWNFKPGKGIKVRGTRKKTVREKAKAKTLRKYTKTKRSGFSVQKGIPIVANKFKGEKAKAKAKAKAAALGAQIGSPMQARNMFNATLSDAIKDNMGGARLHNVSGRFADSVHVHNVMPNKGTSGIVQYSYMYNPYKVFEGHETRDPRLLIDQTIREQAAEMALGAFTTQRL